MIIKACVKNIKTKNLPQIQSPVALLFMDEGGLANHPLSCHPQGVFGSQENERKREENERKEKKQENSRPVLCIDCRIKKGFFR